VVKSSKSPDTVANSGQRVNNSAPLIPEGPLFLAVINHWALGAEKGNFGALIIEFRAICV
jgi:hypothetical protein